MYGLDQHGSILVNRTESLELYGQGADAWNRWATYQLACRDALEEEGKWSDAFNQRELSDAARDWYETVAVDFEGVIFHGKDGEKPDAFVHWVFPGRVSFENTKFMSDVDFIGAQFHGPTRFTRANFHGCCEFGVATFFDYATFDEVEFKGKASLGGVTFHKGASFEGVTFSGESSFEMCSFTGGVSFDRTTFLGQASYYGTQFHMRSSFRAVEFRSDAWFLEETRFHDEVRFDSCLFAGDTRFGGVEFDGLGDFTAIRSRALFSLVESRFNRVPDFIAAHMVAPPLFEEVDLAFERLKNDKEKPDGLIGISERWRALRKLAQQAHDERHALDFHRAEIRTRRGEQDKPWHMRWWAGWFYQLTSDFGLSISRPLYCLFGLFALCAALYWYAGDEVGTWPEIRSAMIQSGHNTAPFAFIGSSELLKAAQIDLYGYHGTGPERVAAVPFGIQVVGAFQFVFSSILVFVAGLAIRNHFRIR